MTDFEVEIKVGQQDILAHSEVPPEVAVAELVWNAIDADATTVRITTDRSNIDAPPDRLTVVDNGTGIRSDRVKDLLSTHRESWKREARLSLVNKRPMHGRNGRGRFRVYAIAREATWTSVAADDAGDLHEVEFSASATDITKFRGRSDETLAVPASRGTGTTVVLRLLDSTKVARLGQTGFENRLAVVLAPTLLAIADVTVIYDHVALDPASLIEDQHDFEIDWEETTLDSFGQAIPAPILRFIEWKHGDIKPQLFLCDANGAAVTESAAKLPKSPGIHWTAYLLWDGFIQGEVNEGDLQNDEMQFPVVKKALHHLGVYLSQRADESIDESIGKWRADDTYPYKEPPTTIVEEVQQRTFRELVAATRKVIPESKDSRRMMLGLMQATLNESPSRLPEVMKHVRGLTASQIDEFADLLKLIELPNIIRAGKEVADRVNFLAALESLLFDSEHRDIFLEKQQLHPLIDAHPWMFGAEWSIAASEVSLTNAYARHIDALRPEDAPERGKPKTDDRRIDLLYTAGVKDDRRHRRLVVELKRANKQLDRVNRDQISDYAQALVGDNQFAGTAVDWDFWLVGTSIHPKLRDEVTQKDRPRGLLTEKETANGRYRIWIVQWSELIHSRRAELEFFQQQFKYNPAATAAVELLREMHPDHVPNVGEVPEN